MRVGDYWKRLTQRIGFHADIHPDEYEIFNGTIVFWFGDPTQIKPLLQKLREAGISFEIEWDREEGFMGISLKRKSLL